MKITIESTSEITRINGTECRIWRGHTEGGVACYVYVHRLAVQDGHDQSAFERELLAQPVPPEGAASLPLEARSASIPFRMF